MIARLRTAWREQGFAALAYRACAGMVHALSLGRLRLAWYVLVAQPVRKDWRLPARMGRDIEVRRFESEDALLHLSGRPDAVLAARFAQGSVCFAAVRGAELLGFLWVCPRQYIEDDVRAVFVLPRSGHAWWDYDVWIAPHARNGVLFGKLWQAAHEWLASRDGRWTLSRIAASKPASLAAHARAGAIRIGQLGFLCGCHWQLAFGVRPPLLHLSRDEGGAPRIPLGVPHSAAQVSTEGETPQCR